MYNIFAASGFWTSEYQLVFSYNSLLFCTPLHGFAVCGLTCLVFLLISYLSHALLEFCEMCATFYLMHTLQAQPFSCLSCYLTSLQSVLYTDSKRFHNSYLKCHFVFNF